MRAYVRAYVRACMRACVSMRVCECRCGVRKEKRDPYIDVIFAVADPDVVQ